MTPNPYAPHRTGPPAGAPSLAGYLDETASADEPEASVADKRDAVADVLDRADLSLDWLDEILADAGVEAEGVYDRVLAVGDALADVFVDEDGAVVVEEHDVAEEPFSGPESDADAETSEEEPDDEIVDETAGQEAEAALGADDEAPVYEPSAVPDTAEAVVAWIDGAEDDADEVDRAEAALAVEEQRAEKDRRVTVLRRVEAALADD